MVRRRIFRVHPLAIRRYSTLHRRYIRQRFSSLINPYRITLHNLAFPFSISIIFNAKPTSNTLIHSENHTK